MINPKEKAIELAKKFDKHGETDNAKQCTLICVDELIEEHTWSSPISWNKTRKKYWEAVQTEIKNL